jgi:hypothetical protein
VSTYTNIKLGGKSIKQPFPFTIERYNITKAGRVASGLMTLDLVAKKRKFLFRYSSISGSDMNTILSVIDTNDMFFTISYEENGVAKSATVYAGHIPSELVRSGSEWYWKDVNFDLIER